MRGSQIRVRIKQRTRKLALLGLHLISDSIRLS